jgi:DNA-binding LytR/AlgR family response regulator
MIKFAICDDENYFLTSLRKGLIQYAANKGFDAHIAEFSSGEDLLNAEFNFDILLMDIKLHGKSGIDVVNQLHIEKKNFQVIFITSYQEYAFQAFDLDAIHYLLKPVSTEKLYHALDKALKWATRNDCKTLAISRGNSTQRIFIRDILYCEAVDHKIFIHTATMNYDYFGTLEALQKKLDKRFFRCHRSYIVNLNYIISKGKDMATVVGGDKILVSRRRQQEFAQKLLTFFREEAL